MKTVCLVAVIMILTVVWLLALWAGGRGVPGLAERHVLEGVFAPAYDQVAKRSTSFTVRRAARASDPVGSI